MILGNAYTGKRDNNFNLIRMLAAIALLVSVTKPCRPAMNVRNGQ